MYMHIRARTGHACTCRLRVPRTRARRRTSLRQQLQQLQMIKFHDVPRRRCQGSPKQSELHQPCKCYYHYNTMCRSTPTRRTTQVDMADVPAMLYRLMDRRGHGRFDATHIYTNTIHGEVKRRLKTTTTAAESEVLRELAHGGN